jgi:YD repeat-containing protein
VSADELPPSLPAPAPADLHLASGSPRSDRFAPRPPAERRARQNEVEQLFVLGIATMRIAQSMAAKYGVTTRVIHSDMARIRRRWDAEDRRRGHVRRQRQIRALEDLAVRCFRAGDRDGERQARLAVGRLLGMGREPDPASAEPRIVINVGVPEVLRARPQEPRAVEGTRHGVPLRLGPEHPAAVPAEPHRRLPPAHPIPTYPPPGDRDSFPWDEPT